ncbi:hypothetical protein BDN72DRAFT_880700 [Pluteus cervinus]|uniref:Uncharacterized protein n=1 Tax=Pluteus cervinus TaxID=181527 RepID=A0ACD3ALL3_9AGAR|nr:hypothetical protein BDN72DRAFT_880700 [Pluteus cervinus]
MSYEVLPYEIWRQIVDITGGSSVRDAATLALVSRDFEDWVQPFLYATIVYYKEGTGWPLKVYSLGWFAVKGAHLRNLLWGEGLQMDLLCSILEICTRLENLAVWVYVHETNISVLRPVLSKLSLRQLSINLFSLFGTKKFGAVEAQDPMFRSITHLDVINDEDHLNWDDLIGLQHLPRLTHLGLQYRVNPNATDGILKHCKDVEVVVVVQLSGMNQWDHTQDPDTSPGEIPQDARLLKPPLRTVEEWKAGAIGEMDIWQKAEEVIARRRKQGSWLN